MTADKPTPVVPNLRFPEFQKTPAWCVELLGCLFRERKETGLSELPLLSVTDREGVIPQEQTNRKNTSNSNKSKYLRVVPGDIAYNTMRMWEGRSARVGIEGVVSPAYTVCLPGADTNTKFFAYYFKTDSLIRQFRKYSQGLVKDTLNLKYEAFSHIPVGFPPPDEQQMIADCLGSLDDLIAAEGRKLEALRQHKQGLMQQLFPQPGETVPRLRFPEFSEEGAWEETTIGNMGEVITGSTPSTSRRDFYGGDFMFVSPADISDLRFVEETKTTLTEAGIAECRPIKKNSVLFVCIGSTIGKVAQCSRPCATNQQINSLVASPAFIADFAYYLLDRESVRIARLAGKQAVPIINKSLFSTVKVTAPAFAEQQRIADCLSSLDARLAAQVRKLNVVKTHKQGLLQQLFPALEAQ